MANATKLPKPQGKWRRSYKACLNCRARKVRCDLGSFDNPHAPPCIRCKRERRECVFTPRIGSTDPSVSTNGASGNVSASPALSSASNFTSNNSSNLTISDMVTPQQRSVTGPDSVAAVTRASAATSVSINDKWRLGVTSMQNTLEFLASAAGTVAEEDDRVSGSNTEYSSAAHANPASNTVYHEDNNTTNTKIPSPFLDPSDTNIFAPILDSSGGGESETVALIEQVRNVRPKPRNTLSNIDYIGVSRLLSESEAVELIDAFFLTMLPFFPYIPLQLQDPDELAEYPILLCAILTVSSRYHPFSEFGLYNGANGQRNVEVHEQLWSHCQWMISQTIWAEAGTRSIGTVLAFIILTDWNPRQIHFKNSDYGNSFYKRGKGKGENGDAPIPTGVGAIRRSDRMAWMLTGTAVRLAQDMDFIQSSSKIFVAAHIADTFASINMNQRPVLADTFSAVGLGANQRPVHPETGNDNNDDETGVAAGCDETGIANERFYLDEILRGHESRDLWKAKLRNAEKPGPGGITNTEPGTCPLTAVEREFLNDEYVLYYANRGDEQYERPGSPPYPLNFAQPQRAKIEIVRITLVAYDTIYHERGRRKLTNGTASHDLAVLDILSPLLDGWYVNYGALLAPVTPVHYDIGLRRNRRAGYRFIQMVNRESILADYHYCQLYIYSLALQTDAQRLQINEVIKSAKYVELAFTAARAILASAGRVHAMGMLRFMPVRWVVRIVRSVSFVVKCYMTLSGGAEGSSGDARAVLRLCSISLDDTIATIKDAALILREATPDDLHLGVRYSAILLYLCSELQQRRGQGLGEVPQSHETGVPGGVPELFGSGAISAEQAPPIPADQTAIPAEQTAIPAEQFPTFSDQVTDWFAVRDDIGLDFVEPWTQMIEQQYLQSGGGT